MTSYIMYDNLTTFLPLRNFFWVAKCYATSIFPSKGAGVSLKSYS